jgi:heptosyltransferase I
MDSILVVLMGALGDVTRGFSILTPIKEAYPNIKIHWLIEPKCLGIAKLHPLIDEIIVFEREQGLRAVPKLIKELRARKFDAVLDMQRHFKSGFFSLMSGCKKRIGFHRKNCKEFNWLFNTETINYLPETHPKIENYLLFLDKIGISFLDKINFGLVPKDENIPDYLSKDEKYLGIVLGSSWPSKDWPISGYLGLLDILLTDYPKYKLVLLGDKSQASIGDTLLKEKPSPRIVSTAGKTNLHQLLSTLNLCDVIIGPDSGPGHLASALKKPYISLFGPTPPDRVAPFGNEHLVLRSDVPCSPCMKRKCPGLNQICMRLISPKQVASKLSEVLAQ